jgi:hypothetical protein
MHQVLHWLRLKRDVGLPHQSQAQTSGSSCQHSQRGVPDSIENGLSIKTHKGNSRSMDRDNPAGTRAVTKVYS